ncbi:unnamed protein product [Spirodela intermedia]|uniref:non-specific serine/threonine protein kinase n=1 Tax=Spirodela intermedia TaxID=51605 RepID=A0A7I8KP95_SPIIN|nr:unnamed protein product [Spirodela intermedia]
MTSSLLSSLLFFLLFFSGGGGDGGGAASAQKLDADELRILLEVKMSLGISDSSPGFESWRPDKSPCEFSGVSCKDGRSVSTIDLSNQRLGGTIPFGSICRLPSLVKLWMGSTGVSGNVSADIGRCGNLELLDLAGNSLSGVVPDLSSLQKLQVLNLSDNGFTGSFPWRSLARMPALNSLSLGDNPFDPTGSFPEEVLNVSTLTWLYLSNCNIQGRIPPAIGRLTSLVNLELADNFLSGEIPQEITYLTRLWQLELYNNSLTGTLPVGFRNLSNLVYFDASMNKLEGNLSEIRFLTKLVSLQLFENKFIGEVPPELGNFKDLINLSLYTNQLSGSLPKSLGSWADFDFIDVSTNFLTGPIPPDMCKKGTMKRLLMLENRFTGEIPAAYGNCTSLLRFRVSENLLSGEVPAGIWSLPKVNIIDLSMNNLSGPVGSGIGKAEALSQLFISHNQFSGVLPGDISGASSLVSLDGSYNQLSGGIPESIGGLKTLASLHLQGNRLGGEIPASLGSCSSLTQINLAENLLSGHIPASIGGLSNLNSLNLSNNGLSGEIPAALSSLRLSELDLSSNSLSGEVPPELAVEAYSGSFSGNPNLCSSHARFLRSCSSSSSAHSSDKLRTVLTSLAVGALAAISIIVYVVYMKKKGKKKLSGRERGRLISTDSWDMKSFQIVSFDEQKILNAIRTDNQIGKGGSGNVYRVDLGNGQAVAVKHIWNNSESSESPARALKRKPPAISKEFDAEVTALSSIRHMNVVKLFCSITSEDSSLLVYEYLSNGSLWDRLHSGDGGKLGGLDWDTRYEVAVGAAHGLEYLHHGLQRPILHRDVKSSNILLDESFQPRIADFGIAKILHAGAGDGKGPSSTHVVAGTLGYIAPEYAYTEKVTMKSDVYSFGVVLLELVTGRRPIEPEFGENKDIVHWVCSKMTLRDGFLQLLDGTVPEASREEAIKVLRAGVLCTMRLPSLRPSMRSVVKMLEEARKDRFAAAASAAATAGAAAKDDENSRDDDPKQEKL